MNYFIAPSAEVRNTSACKPKLIGGLMTRHDDDIPTTSEDGDMVNLDDMHQDERDTLGLDNQEDDQPM